MAPEDIAHREDGSGDAVFYRRLAFTAAGALAVFHLPALAVALVVGVLEPLASLLIIDIICISVYIAWRMAMRMFPQ